MVNVCEVCKSDNSDEKMVCWNCKNEMFKEDNETNKQNNTNDYEKGGND